MQETIESNADFIGIALDEISEFLNDFLDLPLKSIKKIISQQCYKQFISWKDFLNMIDNEGAIREGILDFHLLDKGIKIFHQSHQKEIKPQQSKQNKIYSVDKIIDIEFENTFYISLLFDENIISIYDLQNRKIVHEYNFPKFYNINKLKKSNKFYDFDEDQEKQSKKSTDYNQKLKKISQLLEIQNGKNQLQQKQQFLKQRSITPNVLQKHKPKNVRPNTINNNKEINNKQNSLFQNKEKNILKINKVVSNLNNRSVNNTSRERYSSTTLSDNIKYFLQFGEYEHNLTNNKNKNFNNNETNFDYDQQEYQKKKKLRQALLYIKNLQEEVMLQNRKQRKLQLLNNQSSSSSIIKTSQFQIMNVLQQKKIAQIVVKFIQNLTNKVQQSRHLKEIQNQNLTKNMSKGVEKHILDHQRQVHAIFKKFSYLPQNFDKAFSAVMIDCIKSKSLHKIKIHNLQKIECPKPEDPPNAEDSKNHNEKFKKIHKSELNQSAPNTPKNKIHHPPYFKQCQELNSSISKSTQHIIKHLKPGFKEPKRTIFQKLDLDINKIYQQNSTEFIKNASVDKEYLNINPRKLVYIQKPSHPMPERFKKDENEQMLAQYKFQQIIKNQILEEKNIRAIDQNQRATSKQAKTKQYIISMKYSKHLQLLIVSTFNQELIVYYLQINKNDSAITKFKELGNYQMKNLILTFLIQKNQISLRQTLICLNSDKTLKLYEFNLQVNSPEDIKFDFKLNEVFNHNFLEEQEQIIYIKSLGYLVTSTYGKIYIFNDTQPNSDKNNFYQDSNLQLHSTHQIHNNLNNHFSIITLDYSYQQDILVLGSISGSIAFYDLFSNKTMSCIQVTQKKNIITNIHIFQLQNQAIIVTKENYAYVYDLTQFQLIQTIQISNDDGQIKQIQSSYFNQRLETLLICSTSSIYFFQAQVDSKLEDQRNKILLQIKWRNIKIDQQNLKKQQQTLQQMQTKNNNTKQNQFNKEKNKNFIENMNQIKDNFFENTSQKVQKFPQSDNNLKILKVFMVEKYMFLYTNQKEIKIIDLKTLKLKYSFIISSTQPINCFDINDFFIVLADSEGKVKFINYYDDSIIQQIQDYENFPQKIQHILILPQTSEYSVVCATADGKLIYMKSIIQDPKVSYQSHRSLQIHNLKTPITHIASNNTYLISVSQDQQIVVSNIVTTCKLNTVTIPPPLYSEMAHTPLTPTFSSQITQIQFIKSRPEMVIIQTAENDLHLLNAKSGEIISYFMNVTSKLFTFDNFGKQLITLNENCILQGLDITRSIELTFQNIRNYYNLKKNSSRSPIRRTKLLGGTNPLKIQLPQRGKQQQQQVSQLAQQQNLNSPDSPNQKKFSQYCPDNMNNYSLKYFRAMWELGLNQLQNISIHSIAFSPDQKVIIIVTNNSKLYYYNIQDQYLVVQEIDLENQQKNIFDYSKDINDLSSEQLSPLSPYKQKDFYEIQQYNQNKQQDDSIINNFIEKSENNQQLIRSSREIQLQRKRIGKMDCK